MTSGHTTNRQAEGQTQIIIKENPAAGHFFFFHRSTFRSLASVRFSRVRSDYISWLQPEVLQQTV